jgi:hypothetical protein
VDNQTKGSGTFRGSAGVLWKAIQLFEEYAKKANHNEKQLEKYQPVLNACR